MISKTIACNYEGVKLPSELLELFVIILNTTKPNKDNQEKKILEVLDLIVRRTPTHINKDAYGVTKSEIEKEYNLSRYVCNEILGILVGGTLVQYEERTERGKYWTATYRGIQLMLHVKQKQKLLASNKTL